MHERNLAPKFHPEISPETYVRLQDLKVPFSARTDEDVIVELLDRLKLAPPPTPVPSSPTSASGKRPTCGRRGSIKVHGQVREVTCRSRELGHDGRCLWWEYDGTRHFFEGRP